MHETIDFKSLRAKQKSIGKSDIDRITEALKGIQFGSVEVIIQDARVIQIDRLEKKRLQR